MAKIRGKRKARHQLRSAVDIGEISTNLSTQLTITSSAAILNGSWFQESLYTQGCMNMTLYHAPVNFLQIPTFAANFIGRNITETDAALLFRCSDAMTQLCSFDSGLFIPLDRSCVKYHTNYMEVVKHIPLLADIDNPHMNCFVGLAYLRGICISI
jgi:hypothetical protein